MGCGSSSGPGATTQQVTQTTSPPPQVLAAYQNLLNRGTAVANAPLQQWQGPTIAGFNPTQQAAFSEIGGAQGAALPYINTAAQFAGQGAAPVFPNVQQFNQQNLAQYQNPYTQQVTQATQNLFNEQNAEQFNQANSAAASAGAFGGDREAVLESQMAQQQQLAEAPALANIQSQGFNTAAGILGQQQNLQLQGLEGDAWRQANAAYQFGGLGNQAQNSLLSGAQAQLSAGDLQQQQQQEQLNVPIEQFYQQQAYPFQTTQFLAGLTEGVGPGFGGTGVTTSPGPNAISQGVGLGLLGAGTAGSLGFQPFASSPTAAPGGQNNLGIRTGGRVPYVRRAGGGLVPRLATGGPGGDAGYPLDASLVPDLSVSYVPPSAGITGGTGRNLPVAPSAAAEDLLGQVLGGLAGGSGSGGGGSGGGSPSGLLGGLKNLFGGNTTTPTDPGAAPLGPNDPIPADTFTASQAPENVVTGIGSGSAPFDAGGTGAADAIFGSSAATNIGSSAVGVGAGDLITTGSSDTIASVAPDILAAFARRGGRIGARASGGLVPHMAAGGDPTTTLLNIIPGFDPSGGGGSVLSTNPDQHNRALSSVGQGIGTIVGTYFGGPPGGVAGGIAGKKIGGGFGNVIAGRDAFNGAHGDFWDNFNPFSKYGAASIGQSLNMAEPPGGLGGGAGGGLPGLGGGLPGIGGAGGGGLPGLGGGLPGLSGGLPGLGGAAPSGGGYGGGSSLPFGLRRGGLVPHRDGGGLVPPTLQGANPLVQQQYQRYAQLPLEQLQRLAVMTPPNTSQGQMIQRAMQQKQTAPASTGAYPSAQAVGAPSGVPVTSSAPQQQPAQPGYAGGGSIRHYDSGGPVSFSSLQTAGGLVPQISLAPQGAGEVGQVWSPGQPYLGSPAGSGPTPTAATGATLSTPLSAAVTGASPTAPAPSSLFGPSINLGNGFTLPLSGFFKRGGLVPHFAGNDGESQAVQGDDDGDTRPIVTPMPQDDTPPIVSTPNDGGEDAPNTGGLVPAQSPPPSGRAGLVTGQPVTRSARPDAGAAGKIDPWLALMQAGAGMMASCNPTLLGGIGEGAAAGLANLGQQKQQIVQQQYRRYAQMPVDQLQRLAARTPPSTPQGQMVQRALSAKRVVPASAGAFAGNNISGQTESPAAGVPGYAVGGGAATGAPRVDDSGDSLQVVYSDGKTLDTGLTNPSSPLDVAMNFPGAASARDVSRRGVNGAIAGSENGYRPVSQFQSHQGAPFVDDDGSPVLDVEGRPMLRPDDVRPQFFVDQGHALASADIGPDFPGLATRAPLYNFRQGGPWDVQRVGSDSRPTKDFVDYATVAIGLYAAAAGIPINEILLYQNRYAARNSRFGNAEMDPTYTNLPKRNVYNTRLGYQLYQSGHIRPSPLN